MEATESRKVRVPKYIDVMDGIRAIAIGLVAWFHFWQQSWITPRVVLPGFCASILGISEFNLEGFVRCGYIFVDLLIIVSAICNFYPYARSILLGEEWPDTVTFYKKRFVRIVPSYLLAVILMFILAVCEHKYFNTGMAVKDLLAHLFYVKTFSNTLMATSPINAVLWTVQIEVLYYLLMPWIAKLFAKFPALTVVGLWGVSLFFARYFNVVHADNIFYYNNNMMTYACHYANGLLVCMLYISLVKSGLTDKYGKIAAALIFISSVWVLNKMIHELLAASNTQSVQITLRFGMSIVFSAMVLSLMVAGKWAKVIFGNGVLRILAGISYNFYIWHQFIAVRLKSARIPHWEGDTPPNLLGDRVWMWKYQILIVVVSLVVAFLLTYFFEKPVAELLKRKLGVTRRRAVRKAAEPVEDKEA